MLVPMYDGKAVCMIRYDMNVRVYECMNERMDD